ncbi:MAG: hypothetical protein MZW92_70600 [Comamonadaceae bacterium]|nr:hypothetical protein [Comamonadaceae bacterium]
MWRPRLDAARQAIDGPLRQGPLDRLPKRPDDAIGGAVRHGHPPARGAGGDRRGQRARGGRRAGLRRRAQRCRRDR